MFKFLRRLWVRFTGATEQAGDDLITSSPDAIKSVYTSAITEAKQTRDDMQKAMGLLFQQRNRLIETIARQEQALIDVANKLQGAVTMSLKEPDNPIHEQAGAKYLVSRQDTESKVLEYKAELERLDKMINEYKGRIGEAADRVLELGKEKAAALTEFTVAKNTLRLKEQLEGLSSSHSTATDEALIAVREKIGSMKAEVAAAQEMGTLLPGRDVYAEIGAEQKATEDFKRLVANEAKVIELKPVQPSGFIEEKKEERDLG